MLFDTEGCAKVSQPSDATPPWVLPLRGELVKVKQGRQGLSLYFGPCEVFYPMRASVCQHGPIIKQIIYTHSSTCTCVTACLCASTPLISEAVPAEYFHVAKCLAHKRNSSQLGYQASTYLTGKERSSEDSRYSGAHGSRVHPWYNRGRGGDAQSKQGAHHVPGGQRK